MVLDRHQHLLAERGRASIPEEAGFPSQVEKRHGLPRADPVFDALAVAPRITEGMVGLMARRAREFAIF